MGSGHDATCGALLRKTKKSSADLMVSGGKPIWVCGCNSHTKSWTSHSPCVSFNRLNYLAYVNI